MLHENKKNVGKIVYVIIFIYSIDKLIKNQSQFPMSFVIVCAQLS